MEGVFGEDFGQKVDLTGRIREVLANYPEGTTILKELIQNADDATAGQVYFCLDRRQHGTNSLAHAPLAHFQGPALLVYNNSVFSDADFESISRVGDSGKRKQAAKTGRFGIGFNSVYHLTDLPSFVSRRYVTYFDPHCRYLPRVSAANPGKRVDFVAQPLLPAYSDQFFPFCCFGCNMREEFGGTLFRFPLRTAEQAADSKLSRAAYTPEKMAALLREFESEAVASLLFLKHVELVSVFEWLPGQPAPSRLFSCRLLRPSAPLRQHRQAFSLLAQAARAQAGGSGAGGAAAAPAVGQLTASGVSDVYEASFECQSEPSAAHHHAADAGQGAAAEVPAPLSSTQPASAASTDAAPLPSGARREWRESFLVAQLMGGPGGSAGRLAARAAEEFDIHLLPWASVAARTACSGAAGAAGEGEAAPVEGRAFCFLPLPVHPSLPVHVNGYFELSSNRRDIWFGADMDGAGRFRSQWNSTLLTSVAAPAYASLLLRAAQLLGPTPSFFSLFPVSATVQPWRLLVSHLFALLRDSPVLSCSRFLSPLAPLPQGHRWVAPSQAAFHDEQSPSADALALALARRGVAVVRVSPALRAALFEFCLPAPTVVTPAAVRRWLRAGPVEEAGPAATVQLADALALLEYCLGDVMDEEAAELMEGLALLPLASKALGAFKRRRAGGDEVVVPRVGATEQREGGERLGAAEPAACPAALSAEFQLLCSHLSSRVLDVAVVPPDLYSRLQGIAASASGGNVCSLSPALLLSFLPSILPNAWFGQMEVEWQAGSFSPSPSPSPSWLSSFWQYARDNCPSLDAFSSSWPLLPTLQGTLCALSSQHSYVLAMPEGDLPSSSSPTASLSPSLLQFLVGLGCRVLRRSLPPLPSAVAHADLPRFTSSPTGPGVLDALLAVAAARGVPLPALLPPPDREDSVGQVGRRELRAFLCDAAWFAGAEMVAPSRKAALQRLPIFETHAPEPSFVALSGPAGLPSAAAALFLPPPAVDPALLDGSFLRPASAQEAAVLASALGVTTMGRARFVQQQIIARLSSLAPSVREAAMLSVLSELPQLLAAVPSLKASLSSLPFLPAVDACSLSTDPSETSSPLNSAAALPLRSPSDLFDPRSEELCNLLAGAGPLFPAFPFASSAVLDALLSLGLRSAVTTDAVLVAARAVEALAAEDPSVAQRRGGALLAYLDIHAGQWLPERPAGQEQRWHRAGFASGFDPRLLASSVSGFFSADSSGREAAAVAEAAQRCASLASFWQQLQTIAWCPVLRQSPGPPVLPWPASEACAHDGLPPAVAPPRQVRPAADLWLCSASLRVLAGESRAAATAQQLGWRRPLGASALAAQLLELGRAGGAAVADTESKQALAKAVPQIYSALSELQLVETGEIEVVKAILEGCRWVWVGDGFCSIRDCAFSGPLHLAPYLRIVPTDLASFAPLLAALGVRSSLAPHEYASMLASLAADAGSEALSPHQLAAAIWLVQYLADAVGQGQQEEAEQRERGAAPAPASTRSVPVGSLFVPDEAGRLAPACDLAYNDAPWLPQFSAAGVQPREADAAGREAAEQDADGAGPADPGKPPQVLPPSPPFSSAPLPSLPAVRFVHAKISNDVAQKLGVRSLRLMLLLHAGADSLSLSLHASDALPPALLAASSGGAAGSGVEAFGQHEALTTRLRHIVEMYAEGPGVFGELVQNADDAGASEVVFLLDRARHGTASLLSAAMAEWQGPALYAWNDSTFSARDLRAIAQIGQDGKMDRPSAIGRFGLGFNSVYHFTDVPSFVSGQVLVMFDPHATNLPDATPAHPGVKISFVGRNLVQQFPDQFRPYLLFGCDLQHAFPATLFRFPLRSAAAAARSEIKAAPTSPDAVLALLRSFEASLGDALLFLRSVRQVRAFVRELQGDPPQLLFVARRSAGRAEPAELLAEEVRRLPALSPAGHPGGPASQASASDPQRPIFEFVRGPPAAPTNRQQFLAMLQRTPDAQLPWAAGQVTVLTGAGEGPITASHWLVCNALGGGAAKEWALQIEHRSRGFVPWAGAAAQLSESSLGLVDMDSLEEGGPGGSREAAAEGRGSEAAAGGGGQQAGRAFCFLPLPVATGLPVHVNGYFELSANRRDLWLGEDLAGEGAARSEWNRRLLASAAAPAYARLLAAAAPELGPSPRYFQLWPTAVPSEAGEVAGQAPGKVLPPPLQEPWLGLATRLFESAADLALPVVFSRAAGGRWLSPDRVVFPDLGFASMAALTPILERAGIPVAHAPPHVVAGFKATCPRLRFLSPALLRRTLLSAAAAAASSSSRRTQQGPAPRSAALAAVLSSSAEELGVLLEYCLRGVPPQKAHEALAGLPLLPLANGAVGAFSVGQVGRVSVGPPAGAHGETGSSGRGWGGVWGEVTRPLSGRRSADASGGAFLLCSPSEFLLLQTHVPHLLVDRRLAEARPGVWRQLEAMAAVAAGRDAAETAAGQAQPAGSASREGGSDGLLERGRLLPQSLGPVLSAVAGGGSECLQLLRVDVAVLAALMPLLLPPAWHGQVEVEWRPADDGLLGGGQAGGGGADGGGGRQDGTVAADWDDSGRTGAGQLPQESTSVAEPLAPAGDLEDLLLASSVGPAPASPSHEASPAAAQEGPSLQWVQQLWACLSSLPSSPLSPLAPWPLLPTCSGHLRQVSAAGGPFLRASASASAPGEQCQWSDALLALFSRAGVSVLRPDVQLAHPGLASLVCEASGAGVVDALAAAASRGTAGSSDAVSGAASSAGSFGGFQAAALAGPHSVPHPPNVAAGFRAVLGTVLLAERRELRSFLCQVRWLPAPQPAAPAGGMQRLASSFSSAAWAAGGGAGGGQGAEAALQETKPGMLLASHIEAVKAMPIFETFGRTAGGAPVFVDLLSAARFFPPPSLPESLLAFSSAFLRADSPREQQLLQCHFGVPSASRSAFFRGHLFPAVARAAGLSAAATGSDAPAPGSEEEGPMPLAAAERDAAMLLALAELPTLAAEDPLLPADLRQLAFVQTASGALRRPSSLFDPRESSLLPLLDAAECFPAPPFSSPAVLDLLLQLGLASSLTLQGLLASALSVQRLAASPLPEDREAAVRRGRALLAQADALCCEEEGAAGEEEAAEAAAWAESSPAGSAALSSAAASLDGAQPPTADVWQQLAAIRWCPVLLEPPTGSDPGATGDAGVAAQVRPPWPRTLEVTAAPVAARPAEDLWQVGCRMPLVEGAARSQLLRRRMGWSAPPPVDALVAQLVALSALYRQVEEEGRGKGEMHGGRRGKEGEVSGAAASGEEGDAGSSSLAPQSRAGVLPALQQLLSAEVPRIYGYLHAHLVEAAACAPPPNPEAGGAAGDLQAPEHSSPPASLPPSHPLQQQLSLLSSADIVWVGDAFMPPSSLAFHSPAHFLPYLSVLPSHTARYPALLLALGVRRRFSLEDFAYALRRLQGDQERRHAGSSQGGAAGSSAALSAAQLSFVLRVLLAIADLHEASGASEPPLKGSVLVPDAQGQLAPARSLLFNDASWLAGGERSTVRLVHPEVPQGLALLLGARSLRGVSGGGTAASSSLPCLPAAVIAELLQSWQADLPLLLFDFLEVADACAATGLDAVLDLRCHGDTSLLQPGLAPFQGPSLTLTFHGAQLSPETLCQLQAPPPFRLRPSDGSSSAPPASCHFGTGLLGAFRVADLLVAAAGDCLCLWDPRGAALQPHETQAGGAERVAGAGRERRGGEAGGSERRSSAVGLAYSIKGSDFANRFPDQFAPLDCVPPCSRSLLPAPSSSASVPLFHCRTVIRLPLRTPGHPSAGLPPPPSSPSVSASTASSAAPGASPWGPWPSAAPRWAEDLRPMALRLQQQASAALLFLSSVESVSFSVWQHGAEQPDTYFFAKVDPASASSSSRTPFLESRAQRKASLFGGLFSAAAPLLGGADDSRHVAAVDVLVRSAELPSELPLQPGREQALWQTGEAAGAGRGELGEVFADIALREEREEGEEAARRTLGPEGGSTVVEKWLCVQLSNAHNLLDLARNKKYLSLHLSPVTGAAACIARKGVTRQPPGPSPLSPSDECPPFLLAPLPVPSPLKLPVALLAPFLLLRRPTGRCVFLPPDPLPARPQPSAAASPAGDSAAQAALSGERRAASPSAPALSSMDEHMLAWNEAVAPAAAAAYAALLHELLALFQAAADSPSLPAALSRHSQLRGGGRRSPPPLSASLSSVLSSRLFASPEHFYEFWPRSGALAPPLPPPTAPSSASAPYPPPSLHPLLSRLLHPLYQRLALLPLWLLHGDPPAAVRAAEGLFLAPAPAAGPREERGGEAQGGGPGEALPPAEGAQGVVAPRGVRDFLCRHYQVFNVPGDLLRELQAAGVAARELTPAMLRALLKSPRVSTAAAPVATQADLLEFCCADVRAAEGPAEEGGGRDHGAPASAPPSSSLASAALQPPRPPSSSSSSSSSASSSLSDPLDLVPLPPEVRAALRRSVAVAQPQLPRRPAAGGGASPEADLLGELLAQLGRGVAEVGRLALEEGRGAAGGPGGGGSGPPAADDVAAAEPAAPAEPFPIDEAVLAELRRVPVPSAAAAAAAPAAGSSRSSSLALRTAAGQGGDSRHGPAAAAAPLPSSSLVLPLGQQPLLLASPRQLRLLPALAPRCLHPSLCAREALALLFSHPRFRTALQLEPFTEAHFATGLAAVLPPRAATSQSIVVPWEQGRLFSSAGAKATAGALFPPPQPPSPSPAPAPVLVLLQPSGAEERWAAEEALPSEALTPPWLSSVWEEARCLAGSPRRDHSSPPAALLDFFLLPAVGGQGPVLVQPRHRGAVLLPPPASAPPPAPCLQAEAAGSASGSSAGGEGAPGRPSPAPPSHDATAQQADQQHWELVPRDASLADARGKPVVLAAGGATQRLLWGFQRMQAEWPWLAAVLVSRFDVPLFDPRFAACHEGAEAGGGEGGTEGREGGDSGLVGWCQRSHAESAGRSLQALVLATVAARKAALPSEAQQLPSSLTAADCLHLLAFFARVFVPPAAPPAGSLASLVPAAALQQLPFALPRAGAPPSAPSLPSPSAGSPPPFSSAELSTLRSLPIFRTCAGAFTAVDPDRHCVAAALPFLPPAEAACLDTTCLQHAVPPLPASALSALLSALGIPSLSDAQTLARFALPAFPRLPSAQQEALLAFLRTNWPRLKEQPEFVEAVAATPFVQRPDRFPAGEFDSACWLPLLRDAGLQRRLTPQLLVACAAELQARADSEAQAAAATASGSSAAEAPRAANDNEFLVPAAADARDATAAAETLLLEDEELGDAAGSTGARARPLSDGTLLWGGEEDVSGSEGAPGLEGPPAAGVSDALWQAAVALTETLAKEVNMVFGSSAMEELGRLRFVPAERGIPTGGAAVERRCLASFADAVLPCDWPLAWAVAPVVVREALVPPSFTFSKLGVRSPPPVELVVQHMQAVGRNGGEQVLARWQNVVGGKSIEDACERVFKFLQDKWGSLEASDIRRLRGTPSVPVANGTRLAPPTSLFARLPPSHRQSLAPFLFELPRRFLPFSALLADLGMADAPSPAQLAAFVRSLQQQRAGGGDGRALGAEGVAPAACRLNPNELNAVLQLLQLHCDLLEGSTPGSLAAVPDAIVVDDHAQLAPARACVFLDAPALPLLHRVDPSRLRLVHPRLPAAVAARLGVPRLSDAVQQVLDPQHPLRPLPSLHGVSLAELAQRLRSRSLAAAVWSMLQQSQAQHSQAPAAALLAAPLASAAGLLPPGGAERPGPAAAGAAASLPRSLAATAQALSRAASSLHFVASLRIRFVLAATVGRVDVTAAAPSEAAAPGEALGGAASPSSRAEGPSVPAAPRELFFVDEQRSRIFLAAADAAAAHLPSPLFLHALAAALSRFLGSPVCLPLAALLASPPGGEDATLAVLQLGAAQVAWTGWGEAHHAGEAGGPAPAPLLPPAPSPSPVWRQLQLAEQAGQPGQPVVAADLPLLRCCPLRPFHAGEVVAWRDDSAASAPAWAAAWPPAPPGGPWGSSVLRYGRVALDVRAPAGQAVCRVQVEAFPGDQRLLLSSSLLCFAASSPARAASRGPQLSTALMPVPQGPSPSAEAAPASPSSPLGARSSLPPAPPTPSAPVPAPEVLQAVREMLASAGVRLSGGQQRLLQQLLSLQEQLAAAEAAAGVEQVRAERAEREAEEARAQWSCRICLAAEVGSALAPCGHAMCPACARSVRRCPFCRQPVAHVLQIYRP